MTVKDIIKKYGYEYLIKIIKEEKEVYVITFAETINKAKLTGVCNTYKNEVCFQYNYYFMSGRIFFDLNEAKAYLNHTKIRRERVKEAMKNDL